MTLVLGWSFIEGLGAVVVLSTFYSDSQVSSLRASFFALILMAIISLLFSKNIPAQKLAAATQTGREKKGDTPSRVDD